MLLELNLITDGSKTVPLFVNTDYIVYMYRSKSCTCVEMVTGKTYRILETPKDILKKTGADTPKEDMPKKETKKKRDVS